MCSHTDWTTGKTAYNPEDDKWWWTPDYSEGVDFLECPIGYESTLMEILQHSRRRWKIRIVNGRYRATLND